MKTQKISAHAVPGFLYRAFPEISIHGEKTIYHHNPATGRRRKFATVFYLDKPLSPAALLALSKAYKGDVKAVSSTPEYAPEIKRPVLICFQPKEKTA